MTIPTTPATHHHAADTCRTVLVVDDEPSILKWLARALPPSGYNVITAPSLGSAITALRHSHVDAMILDLRLIGHSGLEVLDYVRWRLGQAFTDLPVMMFTGLSRLTEDEEDAIRRHQAYVFYKLEGTAPLVATLDKLFQGHEPAVAR